MIRVILKVKIVLKTMVFKTTTNTILSWKPKGLSDEIIKPPRPHTVLAPELSYIGNKTRPEFNGSCLKQKKLHVITEKL